ncbi:MAG: 3-methylornithyl-N6-L-lysine dehydrogenase PylD [Coriobacteriales bacterium]|jgi:pyrrolysine biosynthesis protein PylD|nr:3-methylornithyl-N6-L-lysine dehydrogenase PylD [Coriobacteriales bacterium]
MTRLDESDITGITAALSAHDRAQIGLVGMDYVQMAHLASGYGFVGDERARRVAIVPVTAGEGLIGGFGEAVCAILTVCGASPFVTQGTDVTGLQEALVGGAELVFMADDDSCIAFAPTGAHSDAVITSDNSSATGIGFATALEQMIERSSDENDRHRVLVLGAGAVGRAAAIHLVQRGFDTAVFDLDEQRGRALAELCGGRLEQDARCFTRYRNILDATNTGSFIAADDVTMGTRIAAPGIPLCVTAEASSKAQVYHNPLELGIATMYFDCLCQMGSGMEQGGDKRV